MLSSSTLRGSRFFRAETIDAPMPAVRISIDNLFKFGDPGQHQALVIDQSHARVTARVQNAFVDHTAARRTKFH
jgi:hypothetical protein